jgi:hypothetical protein
VSCPIVDFGTSGLELRIIFVNSFRAVLILLCLISGGIYILKTKTSKFIRIRKLI